MSEHMPDSVCPWCDVVHDAVTNPTGDEHTPSPGDGTLCFDCGEWCVFTEDLTLRKPTTDEFIALAADETCRKIRLAWLQVRLRR